MLLLKVFIKVKFQTIFQYKSSDVAQQQAIGNCKYFKILAQMGIQNQSVIDVMLYVISHELMHPTIVSVILVIIFSGK